MIPDKALLDTNDITAIEITFDVKLTKDAVTAGTGNVNEISLEYTNHLYDTTDLYNPVDPPVGNPPETTTETDSAVVYTFGIKLTKDFVGGDGSQKATFDLYKEDASGTDIKLKDGTTVKVVKIGTYEVIDGIVSTLDTAGSGVADIGLSNGKYFLIETKTENGYNLLQYPVEVNIERYYEKDFGTGEVKYYSDSSKATEVTGDAIYTSVKVENRKGFSFPVTGGRGTIIFTVSGIVLMAIAIVIFVKSKKSSNV